MIRFAKITLRVFLPAFLCAGPLLAQEDLFSRENSLAFARYLQRTQQFDFAAQEYERLHYLWPADTSFLLEMVANYRLSGECKHFSRAYELLSDGLGRGHSDYAREYLALCFKCAPAHERFDEVLAFFPEHERSYYRLGQFWLNKQYDNALALYAANSYEYEGNRALLFSLTGELSEQRFKSPALAMALSALVPGSGRAYSKRWADAAISFVLISTSAFASYRAFHKKGIKSVNGWLFGGISFSFYVSNIYGSYKAAKHYNSSIYKDYQQHAESILHRAY
ncbi:MAG: hypothetical protein CSA96_05740 [Bacteroidetes bacterium]|nr:MAG: hypothetical protein CSA96_05740 [Bacteroidota bacterium]